MIENIMPTKLMKRRVIFVDDFLWFKVEKIANLENKTTSEILRDILKNC